MTGFLWQGALKISTALPINIDAVKGNPALKKEKHTLFLVPVYLPDFTAMQCISGRVMKTRQHEAFESLNSSCEFISRMGASREKASIFIVQKILGSGMVKLYRAAFAEGPLLGPGGSLGAAAP